MNTRKMPCPPPGDPRRRKADPRSRPGTLERWALQYTLHDQTIRATVTIAASPLPLNREARKAYAWDTVRAALAEPCQITSLTFVSADRMMLDLDYADDTYPDEPETCPTCGCAGGCEGGA